MDNYENLVWPYLVHKQFSIEMIFISAFGHKKISSDQKYIFLF
jgi:hypothetical protein